MECALLTLLPLENMLQETEVKGFPIVSADERKLLLGHIGRHELQYVLSS